ncbi:MAG: sulfatase-like hydrolase/transferase [Alcanivoracaceae bacterium]|nr:sulfatase-like hydrolase/transferase [Alcanivoracaceae bacterium]
MTRSTYLTRRARFLLANWLLQLLLIGAFIPLAQLTAGVLASVFLVLSLAAYCGLFLLPGWLVGECLSLLGWQRMATAVTLLWASFLVLFLLGDMKLFVMYGFHVNGFVWNLLTTPGGINSLGGSADTVMTLVVLACLITVLEVLLWSLARRLPLAVPGRIGVTAVGVACLLSSGLLFGGSKLVSYQPVTAAAHWVPFYQPVTFASLARRLDISVASTGQLAAPSQGRLYYPKQALRMRAAAAPMNVVWLVAESLRGDMLTPEVMPNLWQFSQQGQRFEDHLSGGNGTRMGLFSQFYGLPGSYWFSFLERRQPPALLTLLQQRDYRFGIFSSASFTYPEFDQTVFAGLPGEVLHSDESGVGWQRDRRNVERLQAFIDQQPSGQPFFSFFFLESSHARYYFPDESVIRQPYLQRFNYASEDVGEDIDLIFNRYVNATHHLDQQIGRVLDHLRQRGLLDNTVVVVTGDHGEAFMEHGRWGHNSAFTREQMWTPLVLHVPGRAPAVHTGPTSHLDLVPTLMPLLGVENPPQDYALGQNLFNPDPDRYRLCASWDALAYVGPQYTVAMPLSAGGLSEMAVLDHDDTPVADAGLITRALQDRLMAVLADMGVFYDPQRLM